MVSAPTPRPQYTHGTPHGSAFGAITCSADEHSTGQQAQHSTISCQRTAILASGGCCHRIITFQPRKCTNASTLQSTVKPSRASLTSDETFRCTMARTFVLLAALVALSATATATNPPGLRVAITDPGLTGTQLRHCCGSLMHVTTAGRHCVFPVVLGAVLLCRVEERRSAHHQCGAAGCDAPRHEPARACAGARSHLSGPFQHEGDRIPTPKRGPRCLQPSAVHHGHERYACGLVAWLLLRLWR